MRFFDPIKSFRRPFTLVIRSFSLRSLFLTMGDDNEPEQLIE